MTFWKNMIAAHRKIQLKLSLIWLIVMVKVISLNYNKIMHMYIDIYIWPSIWLEKRTGPFCMPGKKEQKKLVDKLGLNHMRP